MAEQELELQHLLIDSGEVSPSKGTLCHKCLAISWKADDLGHRQVRPGTYEWALDHYKTFSDLEASCQSGCPLCQTLFLLLTYDGLGFVESDPLHWELEVERGLWYLKFGAVGPEDMDMWYMFESGRHMPSQAVTTVKGFKPSGLTNDLRALLVESIKPWLEACVCPGAHKNCPNSPPNEEVSYRLPTRLIDVGLKEQPTAKIIISEELPEDGKKSLYLILSYQWGKGNDPARTISKNLDERKDEIIVQDMPKTIRDAMEITRLLGIRYLWVDAVCIIQADRSLGLQQQDEVAKADWERESMNMAAYYTNALCCIAAASANDSCEGFLNARPVERYGYKEWHTPANVFLPSPHAVRRRFRSPLLSRGWCLQEWLLSPRILHWTSNGLIWQCSHGFFWEGQSGFQGEPPEQFSEQPYDQNFQWTNDCILDLGFDEEEAEGICQILQCDQRDVVSKTWIDLVSQFVQMNLSFSTDRLVAVQGVATRLSKRHGLGYFAGVFWSRMVEHLLWRAEYPPQSSDIGDAFPSWSWASSQGEIRFFKAEGAWTSLVSDVQPFPAAEDQGNLLCLTNKELRFTAPLVKLSDLEPEDAGSESEPEDMESENEKGSTETGDSCDAWPGRSQYVFGTGSPVWGGLRCRIHVDNLATPLPLTDHAYLLAMRHIDFGGTEYQGLVVQKDNNEFYCRIGIFFLTQPGEYMENLAGLREWETKVTMI